jgi:carbonic anhydrase
MSDESRNCEAAAENTKPEENRQEEWAPKISRRAVLGGLGAAAAFAAMPGARATFALAPPENDKNDSGHAAPGVSAREAMERLKKGNQRFMDGRLSAKPDLVGRRKKLVAGQQPFATILSCSDSRVPPELVFDQSLGDIFIIRVAGNIIDTDVLGSIEYAVLHLKTPLLYVLGHQKCGAVDAALAELQGHAHETENITALLHKIIPGLKGLDLKLPPEQLLQAAVEANIRWTVKQLRAAPELKPVLDSKKLALVSGVYELASGNVRIMEQSIPA